MSRIKRTAMLACLLCPSAFTPVAMADHSLFGDDGIDLLLGLTANYLLEDQIQVASDDRRSRRQGYHQNSRDSSRRYNRNNERRDYRNNNRRNPGYYERGFDRNAGRPNRRDYAFRSYTSEPIRGGSSRRTRIIGNPYSDRLVTGITLTGIDNDIVHIEDVVAYPGRQFLSPLGYTLSAYTPPRFINTGHYIDYISVAAKRREYFTVTFHYD